MPKSRMLLMSSGVLCLLLTVSLVYFINGAMTLIGENEELKIENSKVQRNNNKLNTDVKNLNTILNKQGKDIQLINQKFQEQLLINTQLRDDYNKIKQERDNALSQVIASRGELESHKQIYVKATAYTAFCDTGCTGITKTGIDLRKNPGAKVIAVDPNIIPLGTKVFVEGYGYAVAGDTGGAIKGYHVDLLVRDTQTAINWGKKTVRLTILE